MEYTQSQAHGYIWEDDIRVKVFKCEKKNNNIDKYDIPCKENIYDKNENISIKTSKNFDIYCSDILRFFNYDFDKNNTIIFINYKQNDNKKVINKIYEINYNEKMRNMLFGNISYQILEEYVNFIKKIPNGKVDKNITKEYKSKKKELEDKYNMLIKISPKVDSKNQRRVQCTITKINEILEKHNEFVKSVSDSNKIRDIEIQNEIISGIRKRNNNKK